MPLASRLSSGQDSAIERIIKLVEQWKNEKDAAKNNILYLLTEMCNISNGIKSGKKPSLEKGHLELYMEAKKQFNPEMLSMSKRHLYPKVMQAFNKAYPVIENYVHEIENLQRIAACQKHYAPKYSEL